MKAELCTGVVDLIGPSDQLTTGAGRVGLDEGGRHECSKADAILHHHTTRHEAVTGAAQFSTLTGELARQQGRHRDPRDTARNGIDLHTEPRHRVAVNDVRG